MYYLRARYYDPATGRFLGRDPAEAGHPYAYAQNNPVNLVDPYGLDACSTVTGVASKVFGGKKKNCNETADALLNVAENAACGSAQTMLACGLVGLGPLGDSYFDYNVTVGCGPVATFGFQERASQGIYTYGGFGSGSCGISGSFSVGYNQVITPGTNCGLQGSFLLVPAGPGFFGPTGQYGVAKEGDHFDPLALLSSSDEFRELGISYGSPGFGYAGTCYNVQPVLSW